MKLLDALELQRFIFNPPETILKRLWTTLLSAYLLLRTGTSSSYYGRYDMSALPWWIQREYCWGVTFDDVMDVAEEEATEDQKAAVTP